MQKLINIVTETIVWFLVVVIIVGLLPWAFYAAIKNHSNILMEELNAINLIGYKLQHIDE